MSRIIYPIYVYEPPSTGLKYKVINSSGSIEEGGYYMMNGLAESEKIGINCQNLKIGDKITWYNNSPGAIVLYGFNKTNAGIIELNRGVLIQGEKEISFFSA